MCVEGYTARCYYQLAFQPHLLRNNWCTVKCTIFAYSPEGVFDSTGIWTHGFTLARHFTTWAMPLFPVLSFDKYIQSHKHHNSQDRTFPALQHALLCPSIVQSSPTPVLATADLVSFLVSLKWLQTTSSLLISSGFSHLEYEIVNLDNFFTHYF
jgi:hypothetical protein